MEWLSDLPKNASGNVKIICPACTKTHSKGKEHNKDLSFNVESKAGKCHRCDAIFYVPIKRDDKKVYAKPEWKNTTDIDDNVIKYFEGRNVSQL